MIGCARQFKACYSRCKRGKGRVLLNFRRATPQDVSPQSRGRPCARARGPGAPSAPKRTSGLRRRNTGRKGTSGRAQALERQPCSMVRLPTVQAASVLDPGARLCTRYGAGWALTAAVRLQGQSRSKYCSRLSPGSITAASTSLFTTSHANDLAIVRSLGEIRPTCFPCTKSLRSLKTRLKSAALVVAPVSVAILRARRTVAPRFFPPIFGRDRRSWSRTIPRAASTAITCPRNSSIPSDEKARTRKYTTRVLKRSEDSAVSMAFHRLSLIAENCGPASDSRGRTTGRSNSMVSPVHGSAKMSGSHDRLSQRGGNAGLANGSLLTV
jgi:hypothetical protein